MSKRMTNIRQFYHKDSKKYKIFINFAQKYKAKMFKREKKI